MSTKTVTYLSKCTRFYHQTDSVTAARVSKLVALLCDGHRKHVTLFVYILFIVNVLIFQNSLHISREQRKLLFSSFSSEPPETNTSKSQNWVDIFTFQKNEGMLLLEWGIWHGDIFGFDALTVIDHQSDDPQTNLHLEFLASKGARVIEYSGNFTSKAAQLTKRMTASKAKFLVPIDVDEFLILNRGGSLVVDDNEILSTFRYLPTDGRRYKMKELNAMYCPRKDTNTRLWSNFSRARQMTVYQQADIHLSCRSKTFYLRSTFLRTDQGNHLGAVTMDEHDERYQVTGCPYFHSPDIGIVHFGIHLPWNIRRDKMVRGAMAYGHTARVEAGHVCCCSGIHYCRFYKELKEVGERAMQAKYEEEIPCESNSNLASAIIAERIEDALSLESK